VSVLDRAVSAHRPTEPKILVIDIETRPMTLYSWGLWNQNHGTHQIIDEGGTLCFAAKWYGEHKRRMIFRSEHEHGHAEMVDEAWRLLDEAHLVVTYNGDRFDIPELNRQFIVAGKTPPSPFKSVDLYRTARQFRFPSRKLDWISNELAIGSKVEHEGWKLWQRCMDGDPKAHKRMETYCRGDVLLTERAYTRLAPWVKNHPNVNMYRAERVSGCNVCGSVNVEQDGFHYTPTRAYARFVCSDCGAHSRATNHEPTMAQHRRGAS
jgi:hypothetical protein